MSIVTGITPADFNAYSVKWFKSEHGIGTAFSCGGPRTTEEITGNFIIHNLFDKVTEDEADLGKTEFRCIYIRNIHDKEPLRNPILIIVQNTASPDDELAIGWGTSPFDGVEQTIATESTPPTNITFKEAPTKTEGAVLGINIPPNSHKALWLRRVVNFDAAEHPQNSAIIRLLTDNVVDEVIDKEQKPIPDARSSFTSVGEMSDSFTMSEIFDRIRGRNSNMHISTGNVSSATATAGSTTATAGGGVAIATAGGVTAIAGTSVISRTRMSFGSDDYDNVAKENYWKNIFGIKKRYSSYQFQNVHFVMMDTTSGKINWDEASEQYEFISKDLTDAAANPANDWIIVLTNKVMYASPTNTEPKVITADLRDLYHPLFQSAGVHIILQGDFHNYQRSYPLGFNIDTLGTSDIPNIINQGQNPAYIIPAGYSAIQDPTTNEVGCIFICDGTGGRTHHNIVDLSFFTIASNAADEGYIQFVLNNTETSRKITGTFYKMEKETYYWGRLLRTRYKPDKKDDMFSITKQLV